MEHPLVNGAVLTPVRNNKVLVIEDEGDMSYLLSKLLKQKNMDFEQVNTLAQAEVQIKEDTPDIIFLDNNLPDGFGVNFIESIKQNYPQVKIVMITAHDNTSTKSKALKRGADMFIPKPFTSEQIFNCLDQLQVIK